VRFDAYVAHEQTSGALVVGQGPSHGWDLVLQPRTEPRADGDGSAGRRCRKRSQGASCKYTFGHFTKVPSFWIAINNRDPNQGYSENIQSKIYKRTPDSDRDYILIGIRIRGVLKIYSPIFTKQLDRDY
jgi:hypothetical protein